MQFGPWNGWTTARSRIIPSILRPHIAMPVRVLGRSVHGSRVILLVIALPKVSRRCSVYNLSSKSVRLYGCVPSERSQRYTPKLVSERRLYDCVDILLGMQNSTGGYGSYELRRGPLWLEWINPAEVFGTTRCYLI